MDSFVGDGAINGSGLYISPSRVPPSQGYITEQPELDGRMFGCVFGAPNTFDPKVPTWRECFVYGINAGTGPTSPGFGNTTDEALWIHVSPQFGCGVRYVRFVGDSGQIYESDAGVGAYAISTPQAGHNRDRIVDPSARFA